MQEKTIINSEKGITEILEVFRNKTNRLGKKPKELKIQIKSDTIILKYEYDINLGAQSIIRTDNENSQIELITSFLLFSKKTLMVVSISIIATISIIWLNKGIDISNELMWGLPIAILLFYLQLKATLKGMHKTSLRLLKRSIFLTTKK